MADIELEKAHNFDFETARTKAKEWLQKAQDDFGINVDYVEGDEQDTAAVSKSGVDAKATLDADKVRFEANLGFLAKAMKGPITKVLKDGLDEYFG